jgi:hypothetical protein
MIDTNRSRHIVDPFPPHFLLSSEYDDRNAGDNQAGHEKRGQKMYAKQHHAKAVEKQDVALTAIDYDTHFPEQYVVFYCYFRSQAKEK